jgi:hypothetical protein
MRALVTSAAPATSAPLRKPIPLSDSTSRRASRAVPTPIGMFTKKIQCQLMPWVRKPPSRSPIDAPAEATKL